MVDNHASLYQIYIIGCHELSTPLMPRTATEVLKEFMIQKLFLTNFEGILNHFEITFH